MAGERILIVEDEPLISMMLEDFLESLDYVVHGCAESVADATALIGEGGFDLAILDVNLQGESVWPAARLLVQSGKPFLLASGGHVDEPPAEFKNAPMLGKPYTIARVKDALEKLLAEA